MAVSWEDLVNPAITVIGAIIGDKAGKKAVKESSKGNEAAIAETQAQLEASKQDITPWMETGERALTDLERLIRPGMMSAEERDAYIAGTPGYGFAKSELDKALMNRHAATGNRWSGKGVKEIGRWYDQYLMAPYYDKTRSGLQTLAGYGPQGTNMLVNLRQNASGATSNLLQQEALNQANAALMSGKLWNNTIKSVAGDLIGSDVIKKYLSSLTP